MNCLDNSRLPLIAARVFSRSTLLDIVSEKPVTSLHTLLNQTSLHRFRKKNLSDIFHTLYEILLSSYQNEYIYKNTIALKIVKGRHKFSNVGFVNELRAGKSVCDIAIFNGTSTAYEIKSKLDNFDRLQAQLLDYQSVFDKVYVVADHSKLLSLEKITSSNIGICEITKRGTISVIREATSNLEYLSHEKIFYTLRPSEIQNFVVAHFGYQPDSMASRCRSDCLELFRTLDIELVNQVFIEVMKSRKLLPYEKEIFNRLPDSLLALLLNLRLNKPKLSHLADVVERPYQPQPTFRKRILCTTATYEAEKMSY